jgi:phytoene dehydrogenase-like protein
MPAAGTRHRVVIIGSGFGGLTEGSCLAALGVSK